MAKSKKTKNHHKIFSILIIVIAIIYSIYESEINETFGLPTNIPTFNEVESNLIVRYIDVGQADAILIQNNNESMLIDAGNNEDGKLLVKYFKDFGIDNFKYVVGTHPHEDHIGGLDDVINNFRIDKIYLPDAITTTKTFMDVLDAIDGKKMTYSVPKIDEEFWLGESNIKVIYTGTDTNDLNNTSIVLKLTFGNTSFLFMGDATDKTEKVILNKDIQATVLKVGHHGSKYSTTDEFLNKVNPKYAVISVAKYNSYNHPHTETLDKLKDFGVKTYRTDKLGTIVIQSDGEDITITSGKTDTNGG